jgi:hypothetical protein
MYRSQEKLSDASANDMPNSAQFFTRKTRNTITDNAEVFAFFHPPMRVFPRGATEFAPITRHF